MFFLSLRGLGIGNWETPVQTGEHSFLQKFGRLIHEPVVFDVGANVGKYSNMVRHFSRNARIYAFEPHPLTFEELKVSATQFGYDALQLACGSETSDGELFDYAETEDAIGTEHASLIQNVIEDVHRGRSTTWDVSIVSIDDFVEENDLKFLHLLKIDVEGAELNVLKGASRTLGGGKIGVIHFEFTEANTVSRVFMKDFYELLEDFEMFRMVQDGLVPLGQYFPLAVELFGYQNIVAVRRGLDWDLA